MVDEDRTSDDTNDEYALIRAIEVLTDLVEFFSHDE
jgi:hypothetical protein